MESPDTGNDFVEKFLYGENCPPPVGSQAIADILMDERTEGWIGIPHGGVGMGIIMDMAMRLESYPELDDLRFPLSADFRFAGTTVRTGDLLRFEVTPVASGAEGSATVDRDSLPYITSSIRYRNVSEDHGKSFSDFMPAKCDEFINELDLLPYYKNCFVCGVERGHPGLNQQFSYWKRSDIIAVSQAGLFDNGHDPVYRFSRNGLLHPLPVLAILDEILGWGGIMLTGSGAVTVSIGFTFYRPIACGEKLLFFGRGDRARGRSSSRLLVWASGGAASVRGDGTLEMVAGASGQWFGIQDLTRQMRSSLLPAGRMERVFELASAPQGASC